MGEAILVKREPLWTKEFVALILQTYVCFRVSNVNSNLTCLCERNWWHKFKYRICCRHVYRCGTFVRPLTGNALQKFNKKSF